MYCAHCKGRVRKFYSDRVPPPRDGKFFCSYAHRNAFDAGHTYVPYWHSTYTVVIVALVLLLVLTKVVMGHEEGSPYAEWYLSQENQRGGHCCDLTDAHEISNVEWRYGAKGIEVNISGAWHQIEPWQMTKPDPNPERPQGAVVWYKQTLEGVYIYCFSMGTLY